MAITQGQSEARRQSTLPQSTAGSGDTEKEREEEMKFKVSTTVTTYEEVMKITCALAGIVNNINVTDCEGEEDEDDDDQI